MLSVNCSFRAVVSTLRRSPSPLVTKLACRQLYSPSSLGLDGYRDMRDRVQRQFVNLEDKFKSKMNEIAKPDSSSMIFTEDLKHMIHLAQPSDVEIDLLERMLLKFAQQNKEMKLGSFIFGPVVMRMYYHLNKPDKAFKMFTHPEMEGFFDQLISYQILLDLLFNNQMFNEMLQVFDIMREKKLHGLKYPKNSIVLVLAACYKLNTEESFQYMKTLWSDLTKSGYYPVRRSATFAAALAINQNAPHIALEILTSLKFQSYVTVRNLKLAALASLNRLDNVLTILRSGLQYDDNRDRKHTFAEEIITQVQDAFEKSGDNDLIQELNHVLDQLKSFNQITSEPLSAYLCSEISSPEQNSKDTKRFRVGQVMNKRLGLNDMY